MPEGLTQEEALFLAEKGYRDPVFFCRTFLSEWFPHQMPWVHRGILAILTRKTDFLLEYGELDKITSNFLYKIEPEKPDSPECQVFTIEADGSITMVVGKYTLIMMPRGFSKTTLVNAAAIYNIVYEDRKFLAYLSESGTHSSMQLSNIKRELESNDKIKQVFGDLVPGRQEPERWTHDHIEVKNGVTAMSRGRGAQVRGALVGGKRPDYILMDDVEDEESVNTIEQRQKTQKWAYEAVMPALPPMDPSASIVAAGTLLHNEALLQFFARDPEWTTIIFGALDRQGDPLWPEAMTERDIERKKRSFALAGNLSGFYREYFNTLRDDETAKFRENFEAFQGPQPQLVEEVIHKALAVDPAISERKKSDYHAQAAIGMTYRGKIVVLDCDGKHGMDPRAAVDWYFDWIKRFQMVPSDMYGVEAVAYQQALVHLLREEMFRRHTYFEIEPIKHGNTGKVARVEGALQPRYASGYVVHARRLPLLEQQLLDWPNDKMDLPDAVAMAVTLLDRFAAQAADPSIDLADDEYEPLERVIGGDWRTAP